MELCPPVLCWRNLSGARVSWGSHRAARPENSGTALFLSGGLNSVRSQVKKKFPLFHNVEIYNTRRSWGWWGWGGWVVFVLWCDLVCVCIWHWSLLMTALLLLCHKMHVYHWRSLQVFPRSSPPSGWSFPLSRLSPLSVRSEWWCVWFLCSNCEWL